MGWCDVLGDSKGPWPQGPGGLDQDLPGTGRGAASLTCPWASLLGLPDSVQKQMPFSLHARLRTWTCRILCGTPKHGRIQRRQTPGVWRVLATCTRTSCRGTRPQATGARTQVHIPSVHSCRQSCPSCHVVSSGTPLANGPAEEGWPQVLPACLCGWGRGRGRVRAGMEPRRPSPEHRWAGEPQELQDGTGRGHEEAEQNRELDSGDGQRDD